MTDLICYLSSNRFVLDLLLIFNGTLLGVQISILYHALERCKDETR